VTDLAGFFLFVEKVSFDGRPVRVVAQAASLQHRSLVSVDFGKVTLLMATETATFEDETAAPVQLVALCALHAGNRRMLMKWLKGGGRIRTYKEVYLLLAACPRQYQGV
jgi:hypothetical protein